ncbi:hypothetical protein Tco_0014605 [Tanacetum coccineum]
MNHNQDPSQQSLLLFDVTEKKTMKKKADDGPDKEPRQFIERGENCFWQATYIQEDDEEDEVEWGCRYGYDNDGLQWLLFCYSRSFMQPQYVDREKSLSRPLPPAAIVEPKKDDNTKGKKGSGGLFTKKHDGYSALSISAVASNNIRDARFYPVMFTTDANKPNQIIVALSS